jgi:hypothetical protein
MATSAARASFGARLELIAGRFLELECSRMLGGRGGGDCDAVRVRQSMSARARSKAGACSATP